MKSKKILSLVVSFALLFFNSCDVFKDKEIVEYSESVKSLDGSWQLKSVSRNGVDISNTMNFSQFRMNLNSDGTYTLDNYLPFSVKQDGTWKADDPQYPFNLLLKENGSNTEVNIKLKYPIVDGKRIVAITLSPGCLSNTYQYVFEKKDNN